MSDDRSRTIDPFQMIIYNLTSLTLHQNELLIKALKTADGASQQSLNGSLNSQLQYHNDVVAPAWAEFEKSVRDDKYTLANINKSFGYKS